MATRKCLSADFLPHADPGDALVALLDGAAAFVDEAGVPVAEAQRLAIVVEEIVSNAALHGTGGRRVRCVVTIEDESDGIAMTFEDDGVPFDPTARATFAGPDPRTGGGVGLELVRTWCAEMTYERIGSGTDTCNRLRLKMPRERRG